MTDDRQCKKRLWHAQAYQGGAQKILGANYEEIEKRFLEMSKGEDLHAKRAAEMFNVPVAEVTDEQRRVAKAYNFGLAYGMTLTPEEFIKKLGTMGVLPGKEK